MTLSLGYWNTVTDGDPRLVALYERHYSANPNVSTANRIRYGVSGVGESMILLTPDCSAGFIWVRNTVKRADGQTGVQCSFFRNEGPLLASELIKEASEMAWRRWIGERLWTYVNPSAIKSSNPGYCFIQAGWKRLEERSKKQGLVILEIKKG